MEESFRQCSERLREMKRCRRHSRHRRPSYLEDLYRFEELGSNEKGLATSKCPPRLVIGIGEHVPNMDRGVQHTFCNRVEPVRHARQTGKVLRRQSIKDSGKSLIGEDRFNALGEGCA